MVTRLSLDLPPICKELCIVMAPFTEANPQRYVSEEQYLMLTLSKLQQRENYATRQCCICTILLVPHSLNYAYYS